MKNSFLANSGAFTEILLLLVTVPYQIHQSKKSKNDISHDATRAGWAAGAG